jgi:hypothetical protein
VTVLRTAVLSALRTAALPVLLAITALGLVLAWALRRFP